MSTRFFTNREGNTLIKKFEGVFEHNPGIKYFDALVGFVRASGYFHLRPFMEKLSHVRILVGINADELLATAQQKGLEFFANHTQTKEEFIEKVLTDINKAQYNKETEKGILQFIQDIIDHKIEVRSHPSKRIHAKIYIFYENIHSEHNQQRSVITGSSNLTASGLGLNKEHNYEFNVQLHQYEDVKYAWDEFEFLWNESISILPVDASNIINKSYLKDDFTPFEIYIKMLIEYFGKRVEYDPYNIELLLPDKYMRLKYQTDAANHGYAIMMKHNGFILADVVGLGKTIVACMVIKKYIYENGTRTRVLIVCPPAILDNWYRTAEDFQIKNHFTFISIGSLEKILDEKNVEFSNADRYDLIVVDESHKFRNDYTGMYIRLQEICKRPRSRPGENGDIRKKIILISATPLNNRPEDIENQLYLFQDKRNPTIEGIPSLQDYFKPINDKYKKLAAEPQLNIRKLQELFNKLRNDVIEPLVIRRTGGILKRTKIMRQI